MSFLSEIEHFSRGALRKTETNITTADGRQYTEQMDEFGYSRRVNADSGCTSGYVVDYKPDLQVGRILPYLLLGRTSQSFQDIHTLDIVGAVDVIHDIQLLEELGVTHILNVTTMAIEDFPEKITYKHVYVTDIPEMNIAEKFDECFAFIDTARHSGGRILVHCMAGVSRSASVVIGYLMKFNNMNFSEAFEHVKKQRPCICPNEGFIKQLKELDNKLYQQ